MKTNYAQKPFVWRNLHRNKTTFQIAPWKFASCPRNLNGFLEPNSFVTS